MLADFKIYPYINNIEDCKSLQRDLVPVERWCIKIQLFLNINKCRVITFTRKQHHIFLDFFFMKSKLSTVSVLMFSEGIHDILHNLYMIF